VLITIYFAGDPNDIDETEKRKSIPITGLWGPDGSGKLRISDCMTSALEGGRLSALRTGRLHPLGVSRYSFLRG
jgi:hypothetical protein